MLSIRGQFSKGLPFKLRRGIRQVDPISPKLFSSPLEDIFRSLNWNGNYKLDGRILTNLRFADDVVLFARNGKKLQQMLQDLSNCSKNAGLTMNMAKNQVMTYCKPFLIRVHSSDLHENKSICTEFLMNFFFFYYSGLVYKIPHHGNT